MNAKIKASALKEMHGKFPDDIVWLRLRTTTPLTGEDISLLTELLYDNGMVAFVRLKVGRVDEVAGWEKVLEII